MPVSLREGPQVGNVPAMACQVALVVKNSPANAEDPSRGLEEPLEAERATHSFSCLEKSHGQRSLASYSPWHCKDSGQQHLST